MQRGSAAAASGAEFYDGEVINPTLKPRSAEKFYKKDYPYDKSPRVDSDFKFKNAYPVVQDYRAYDRDFVRDENNDSGEWQAQETYDKLRSKIHKDKVEVEEALEKERGEQKGLEETKAEETAAEKEAKEAEAKTAEAKRRLDKASAEVDRLTGTPDGKQAGGKIGESAAEVNKEIKDVEGCKEEFRRVQEKLKRLKEEKKDREQVLEAATKDAAEIKALAKGKHEAAQQAEYGKLDEKLQETVVQRQRAHEKAATELRMSEDKVARLEADLKKAASSLRETRKNADPAGGLYYRSSEQKSGAHGTAGLLGSMVLALCLAAAA